MVIDDTEVIPDEYDGKCRGGMRAAQSEYETALLAGVLKDPATKLCRKPLTQQRYHGKGKCDDQRLRTVREHTEIDKHSDTDQKKGNEQRIPYELDTVHQRGSMGNQAVQCQPRRKRSNDGLQSGDLGDKRGEEYNEQNKDEVGVLFIFKAAEEPGCYPGNKKIDNRGETDDGDR